MTPTSTSYISLDDVHQNPMAVHELLRILRRYYNSDPMDGDADKAMALCARPKRVKRDDTAALQIEVDALRQLTVNLMKQLLRSRMITPEQALSMFVNTD